MIDGAEFLTLLDGHRLSFITGVPDSRLKQFCACLDRAGRGLTCANEGNAIGSAAGHYLATGEIGVCYFQNSGLGNAYNPLVSLAHPEVYAIPMLLLIGWRGEPGTADEPQHLVQGRITAPTLDLLGIKHTVLPLDLAEADHIVSKAVTHMKATSSPFALLVRGDTFDDFDHSAKEPASDRLTREAALKTLVEELPPDARLVATTGHLSRELFEARVAGDDGHVRDFLTVGSMGHASSIALGLALGQLSRPIICLDGDGAALMHLGAMATIGRCAPSNLVHVLFNNGVHESVGGQPTAAPEVDFSAVARACGYRRVADAVAAGQIRDQVGTWNNEAGPAFLEIKVATGSRDNLGRPTTDPTENKNRFMNGLS